MRRFNPRVAGASSGRVLLLIGVLLSGVSGSFATGARADDLVAPPMGLARLRILLEDGLSLPPTAAEWSIVVSLHRDMIESYGSSRTGLSGDAWRSGNSLYDELRFMKRDPTRRRMKEVVDLQERMLAEADAAERAMFSAIAEVLSADALDESPRAEIVAAVERARAVREADRLLASFPLGEPSGAIPGLREAVGRIRVSPEVRDQIDAIVAERDASLPSLLRRTLREYQDFAIAAAAAFEEVFGGVLPPIGAALSDAEAERLRARMRQRCEREGEAFLAARRTVRAREDATVERLCAILPPDKAIELRLRLSPSAKAGSARFLLLAEGQVRDALRDLPADDPVRAEIEAFAPRWRKALREMLHDEVSALREQEDSTFWDPSVSRSWLLSEAAEVGLAAGRPDILQELDRILAGRVADAGGTLGNLVAERSPSGEARLLERRTMGEWRREVAEASDPPPRVARLRLVDVVTLEEERLSAEFMDSMDILRRGVPRKMDRSVVGRSFAETLAWSDRWSECVSIAWSAYESRWAREVEAAIAPLTEARRSLRRFDTFLAFSQGSAPADAGDRIDALLQALRIRDGAWRAAEAADEAFFAACGECAAREPASVRRVIALARLARFLVREERIAAAAAPFGPSIDALPSWTAVVRQAKLESQARERVEIALAEASTRFMADSIERRQLQFDQAAAMDLRSLGLAGTPLHRGKERSAAELSAANLRAARATARLVEALFAAAGDGPDGEASRDALESAAIEALYRGWSIDPIARGTARRAETVAATDEERRAVAAAFEAYTRNVRAVEERAARLALAVSPIAEGTQGVVLFAALDDMARAGSDDRFAAALDRERADLRAMLEIELAGILGNARWATVAPPDVFELLGVGGR